MVAIWRGRGIMPCLKLNGKRQLRNLQNMGVEIMSARTFILLLAVATITTIGFVNTDVIAASPSDRQVSPSADSNQQADANVKPPFRREQPGGI